MLQQLNVVDDSCKSTLVLKSKGGHFGHKLTFQFINNTVVFLLTYVK